MRERILNTIGLSLLAICFLVSLVRIVVPKKGVETIGKETIIRIAHFQLESGVRSAIDKIAAEYMQLHPGIRIEQIAIPQRIYKNWLLTQLVGETAPDLIEIYGLSEDKLSRFFCPLTDLMNAPNPYNSDNELKDTPLRSTFFDGGEGGYNALLLEYFGIPISAFTNRVYYNLDLLRKITGSEEIPDTYEKFLQTCQKAKEYAERTGQPLIPIAGSKYNGLILVNQLFASQTQKLLDRLIPPAYASPNGTLLADAYVRGDWSLNSPEILSGLELAREVSQQMQPGFSQLQREDAAFYFVQGRALCIVSGSWDFTSFRQQAAFRVGVGTIPLPTAENLKYGHNVLGTPSEAGTNAGIQFGVTRNSKHTQAAKDFLLFLAGKSIQELWTKESGWLPAVADARPNPEIQPFLPKADGYLTGFNLQSVGGADVSRIVDNNFYLLISPFGGPEAFLKAIQPAFDQAVVSDLRRGVENQVVNNRRIDTMLGAQAWAASADPKNTATAHKFDMLMQTSSANDRAYYMIRLTLMKAEKPAQ